MTEERFQQLEERIYELECDMFRMERMIVDLQSLYASLDNEIADM